MPQPKRISEDSSASGQVSASADADADDDVQPVSDESMVSDEGEAGEATATDFEIGEADFNPESPPVTPRANWTSDDFERLETVMRDLGDLNRQLLSFNSEEDRQSQVSASGLVASASEQTPAEADHEEADAAPGGFSVSVFLTFLSVFLFTKGRVRMNDSDDSSL